LPGTLRSEFTKIRSVRSTWLTLAAFFAVTLAAAIGFSAGDRSSTGQASFDPTATSLQAIAFTATLIIVVTGVLVITSEYGTRMMGTSLAAMPRRGVLYAGKAIMLTSVTLVVGLITSFGSFFAGQAVLATTHGGAAITSPGALRAVLLTAVFVPCCALLAFGLGAVIRHTAGAISALFGMVWVIPVLASALPEDWRHAVLRWLPGDNALYPIIATKPTKAPYFFGPYSEVAVFAGYAVIAVAAGALLFLRRDA
jgi:hypothetical protein